MPERSPVPPSLADLPVLKLALAVLLALLPTLPIPAGEAVVPGPAAAPAAPLPGAAPADSATPAPSAGHRAERRLSAMGTWLGVEVEAVDRDAALAAAEAAVRAVERVEARLSTWRDDSELARLNAAPAGEVVPLSPELAAELAAAVDCWRDTGGAFDPGVGSLVAAWGLRSGGRQPSPPELAAALDASGLHHLDLRPDRRLALHLAPRLETSLVRKLAAAGGDPAPPAPPATAVRRHPDLRLEEGGFGKGAGLAAAAAVLAADPAVRSAVVDLGGQLVRVVGSGVGSTVGEAAPAAGWSVAVADPRDRQRPLLFLRLDGGSVATSGNGERGIRVDGHELGHLLDPQDGAPAEDFGSLTVWTRDPLRADCLSTGLYVMGPDRALAWAAERPGVEVLVVETAEDGAPRVRATPGLARRTVPAAAEAPAAEGEDLQIDHPARVGRATRKSRTEGVEPWKGRPSARIETVSGADAGSVAPGTVSKEEYR